MSAWMCGAAHWSVLAEHIARNDSRTPEEIFVILAQTNKDSIDYRYAEGLKTDPDYMYDHTDPFDGGYLPPLDTAWSADEIATLAACYDYQSCEHPGYRDSEAFALISALEPISSAASEALRKARDEAFGGDYGQANLWGIRWDTVSLATKLAS